MKLYALLLGIAWEGYQEPLGIFSSEEEAQKVLTQLEVKYNKNWHTLHIVEYVLNTLNTNI